MAWSWKAGGKPTINNAASAGASQTAGSVKIDGEDGSSAHGDIAVTRASANTTAGFSIVTYQGTGSPYPASTGYTIPHFLGAKPEMIWVKKRSGGSAAGWYVYHKSIGATKIIFLSGDAAASAHADYWHDAEPDANVWSMRGNSGMNENGSHHVAYCWTGIEGYSKFGSYKGNGVVDGPYINLGFKPSFFIVKRTDSSGNWLLMDGARNTYNPVSGRLNSDSTNDESTVGASNYDFTANGVKLLNDAGSSNNGSGTYLYAAFAESPFANNNRGR